MDSLSYCNRVHQTKIDKTSGYVIKTRNKHLPLSESSVSVFLQGLYFGQPERKQKVSKKKMKCLENKIFQTLTF